MFRKFVSIGMIGGVTGIVVGVVVFPLALSAIGFGSAGVAAGSLAAVIQTPTTVAGSAFAVAQSIGATGTSALVGAKIGGVSGAATGVAGNAIYRCFRRFRF